MTAFPVSRIPPSSFSSPGPVSPYDRAEADSADAKVRQQFLTVLVTELTKEGFWGDRESGMSGDGPNKEYIQGLFARTLAEKLAQSPSFQYTHLFPGDR